jgi:hypothetical protein
MGEAISNWSNQASATVGGIAGALFGPSLPNTPNLSVYQPQYTSGADTGAYTGIQSISNNNPYLQNQGAYQTIEAMGLNDPYAGANQTAANAAGVQYGNVGTQGAAGSTALNSAALQTLNTATDPQNQLYNRTNQQVTDAANVANAMNGLSGSPFGAGVADAANQNFNINWQNNQLQRDATGLSSAGGAMTTAQNVGSNAAAATGLSGAIPNQAYITNLNNASNALNNYGTSQMNANNNTQTAVGDFQNYLNEGANQSNVQAQNNQILYGDEMQQYQDQMAGIEGIAGNITQAGSTYASTPSSNSNSTPLKGSAQNPADSNEEADQSYDNIAANDGIEGYSSDQSLYSMLF